MIYIAPGTYLMDLAHYKGQKHINHKNLKKVDDLLK